MEHAFSAVGYRLFHCCFPPRTLSCMNYTCVCVCAVQSQEEAMMSRIRDAEYAQTVAEMKQRIADLEIQVRSQPSLIMSFLYSRFCLLSTVEWYKLVRRHCSWTLTAVNVYSCTSLTLRMVNTYDVIPGMEAIFSPQMSFSTHMTVWPWTSLVVRWLLRRSTTIYQWC